MERVRKLKGELNAQLEKKEEAFKKSLIILSLDEQKEKERKRIEAKLLSKKAPITEKNENDADVDEVFEE